MPSKSLAVFPLDRQMSNDILETGRLAFLSLFLYFLTNLGFFKDEFLSSYCGAAAALVF